MKTKVTLILVVGLMIGVLTYCSHKGDIKNPVKVYKEEVKGPIQRTVKYVKEGKNRVPSKRPTRSKLDISINQNITKVGYKYELFNLGDLSCNIGFNLGGGFLCIGYSLNEHSEVSIGTQGVGVGVRI